MSRAGFRSFAQIHIVSSLVLIGALLSAMLPAVASAQAPGSVAVTLTEFRISVDRNATPSGNVVFNVTNAGQFGHQFLVIKSDLDPVSLPVDSRGVIESQVNVVERVDTLAKGQSAVTATNLSAGRYVLICNVPAHYARGMATSFLVGGATPPAAGTPAAVQGAAQARTQAAPTAPNTGNAGLVEGRTSTVTVVSLVFATLALVGGARLLSDRRAR